MYARSSAIFISPNGFIYTYDSHLLIDMYSIIYFNPRGIITMPIDKGVILDNTAYTFNEAKMQLEYKSVADAKRRELEAKQARCETISSSLRRGERKYNPKELVGLGYEIQSLMHQIADAQQTNSIQLELGTTVIISPGHEVTLVYTKKKVATDINSLD